MADKETDNPHMGTGSPPAADGKVNETAGGIKGMFAKHWKLWLGGIGVAVLGYVAWQYFQGNTANGTATTLGGAAAASGTTAPGSVDGSQLDADYQSMMSLQNQNLGVLNQILTQLQGGTTTGGGGGGGGGGSGFNPQTLMPASKNTSGLSNNFWIYTSQPGDTLASIDPTSWVTQQSSGALNSQGKLAWQPGINPVDQYRNNDAIFKQIGFDPTKAGAVLPVGTRISL